MPKAAGEDAGQLRGFRAGAAFGLPRFYFGTNEQFIGGVPVRKVLFLAAVVTLFAPTAFGALLMDRGLPSTGVYAGGSNPIWSERTNIGDGDYYSQDPIWAAQSLGPPELCGDTFVQPTTAYVTDIRVWLDPNNSAPSYSAAFSSMSLMFGPATPNPSFVPTYQPGGLWNNGTSPAPPLLSSSMSLLPGTPTETNVTFPGTSYPLWQLDFPVNQTLVGGQTYSFAIDPVCNPCPYNITKNGESYYIPFLDMTMQGYSSGYPNDSSDGWVQDYFTDGTLCDQYVSPWGGVMPFDVSVQVFGGQNSVWTLPVSGKWSDSTKWTGGTANAVGAVAVFNQPTNGNLTITLDGPQTIGTLVLGNSANGSTGYTLSGTGANALTFSNSGKGTTITVTDGTHVINAPVILAENLVVTNGGTNSWTLSFGTASSITDNNAGLSLTMNGAGGTLILCGSNSYSGGTTISRHAPGGQRRQQREPGLGRRHRQRHVGARAQRHGDREQRDQRQRRRDATRPGHAGSLRQPRLRWRHDRQRRHAPDHRQRHKQQRGLRTARASP